MTTLKSRALISALTALVILVAALGQTSAQGPVDPTTDEPALPRDQVPAPNAPDDPALPGDQLPVLNAPEGPALPRDQLPVVNAPDGPAVPRDQLPVLNTLDGPALPRDQLPVVNTPDGPALPRDRLPVLNVASRNFVNNRFLILNMHGMLFHPRLADIQEDIDYAAWMNAGVIRVFATDASGIESWTGGEVAERIIQIAPMLRTANVKLIVALVNNHQEVPGEDPSSSGWMDGYDQLLLPFYKGNWRMAYRQFATDLTWLVKERGARDVIWAWEVGNEIHTQQDPPLVLDFLDQAIGMLRMVDDVTPILPGTMGSNHLEPWAEDSPVARNLFCEAPIAAYTLHAYDWQDLYNGGDMPIQYDFQHTVKGRCENGRALPVVVEELGTSRAVPGQYSEWEEDKRMEAELRQIRYVLSQPSVAAIGAWSAESPRSRRIRHDRRRGLTSYGREADGSGSCYGATAENPPGARCQLENVLRALPSMP